MDIVLYVCTSERQAINKTIGSAVTFTGSLRGESSVINPSFIIEAANPTGFNYCYIQAFSRYYFINNITSVRNGLWRIDCNVDVLMSYRNLILNLDVTVSDMTTGDNSTYMSGDVWKSTVKTKTDVINFPDGLLDDGEYILITSGGVAT